MPPTIESLKSEIDYLEEENRRLNKLLDKVMQAWERTLELLKPITKEIKENDR